MRRPPLHEWPRRHDSDVRRLRRLRYPGESDRRLHASGIGNLTVVSNNAGLDGVGLGLLLQTRQIRK